MIFERRPRIVYDYTFCYFDVKFITPAQYAEVGENLLMVFSSANSYNLINGG